MELGIYSFGDTHRDPADGSMTGAHQRIRELVAEIELADQVGLDVFGVGEHHRPDFSVSAPAMVLAAAAARTRTIRLTSAVTVLGSEDPVRVFQQYATLDLLSDGRAEIMAGRGSFIESFPLFGYDLHDYEPLFAEKLELLLALRDHETITWSGRFRAPLERQTVYPRPLQSPLPVWVAVGGRRRRSCAPARSGSRWRSRSSAGAPARFRPLAELYRDAAERAGHDPAGLELGINSFCYIADTSQRAADEFYPRYAQVMTQLGRERGWAPTTRDEFERCAVRAGRCWSAARRRSSRRSSTSTSCSATRASSRRWTSADSRTTGSCTRSSCSGPGSHPRSARALRNGAAARPEPNAQTVTTAEA